MSSEQTVGLPRDSSLRGFESIREIGVASIREKLNRPPFPLDSSHWKLFKNANKNPKNEIKPYGSNAENMAVKGWLSNDGRAANGQ